MAGIYFHIPFCRKACTYCDFHFSTSRGKMEAVLGAMRREMHERGRELEGATIGSIYFGGGTPSLLPPGEIGTLIQLLRSHHPVEAGAEVTLEANPDDITPEALAAWKDLGVTRMSLGIQSFREDRLRFMGRAHTADQARQSIGLIARAGFASWTIDLIYGLPGMDLDEWGEQLDRALDHGMPHLSAYCLTVEERTALAHQVGKGLVTMPGDASQSEQFEHLMERMAKAGLEHYEISNFARTGHQAVHNANYWQGVPYLGIGPSAHSFNGRTRRWNVAHNARYAKALMEGGTYWEHEDLNAWQRTNELLLTGLRMLQGVSIDRLEVDALARNASAFRRHVEAGLLQLVDGRLVLTKAGRHFADRIASDLFVTPDDR